MLELTGLSGVGGTVAGTFNFTAFNTNGSDDSVTTDVNGGFRNIEVIN